MEEKLTPAPELLINGNLVNSTVIVNKASNCQHGEANMEKMKAPRRELVMYKINTPILADEMRQSPALEDN